MAGCMALREDGFLAALQWCDPRPGETFIDLGSGTGKAVLAAAATIAGTFTSTLTLTFRLTCCCRHCRHSPAASDIPRRAMRDGEVGVGLMRDVQVGAMRDVE